MKLAHLWPDDGLRCIFAVRDGKRKQLFFRPDQEPDLWARAESLDADGWDVYFAPATFQNGESRKVENASLMRSFWIDLDCGDGKPYADWRAALGALGAWCKAQGFHLPTDLVLSGYGIHAYWRLTSPIPREVWQQVATQFKHVLAATGLHADPARTADAASVLRVPGLHNHKGGSVAPVKLLKTLPDAIEVRDFVRALPKVGPRPVKAPQVKDAEFGVETEFPPADHALVARKCAQVAGVAEVGGAVEEPLWRAALSIAQRCEDREAAIAAWSEGDERYNPAEARAKAAGTAGPATCAHFNSLNPGGCAGCKWAGKITSPIQLGVEAPEAPPHPEEAPEEVDSRINETKSYRVTTKGVLKKATEDAEEVLVTVCPVWVAEVRERVRRGDESGGSMLLLQWHALDGQRHSSGISQADAHDLRALVAWSADNNLASQVNNWPEFKMYISQMTRELIQRRMTQTYYDTLGWYGDTFVVGKLEIDAEGVRPANVPPSSPLAMMAPKGDLETWKRGVALLNSPEYVYHQFAMLASFGSPLLEKAGRTSALLSLAGPTSSGKSLAAMLAGSIWTDPRLLMHTGQAVTDNAIEVHMGMLRNIPYILDEATHMDGKRQGGLCYNTANGRGKAAVDQRRNARPLYTWSMVTILTTNSPLRDYSPAIVTEAHRVRLLELSLRGSFPKELGAKLGALHSDHHGVAAAPYMETVIKCLPRLREMFDKAEAMLMAEAKFPDKFRFGLWTLAAAFVGGTIAKKAGLIDFDVREVVLAVARQVYQDALQTQSDVDRVVDALAEFTVETYLNTCWWPVTGRGRPSTPPIPPLREPKARYDSTNDILYVPAHILTDFLREQSLSMSNLGDWFAERGVEKKPQRIVPGVAPVWCYCLPAGKIGLTIERADTE